MSALYRCPHCGIHSVGTIYRRGADQPYKLTCISSCGRDFALDDARFAKHPAAEPQNVVPALTEALAGLGADTGRTRA